LRKNLRNQVDFNADMDSLKLSVDQINKDLHLIGNCIPAAYKHLLENPKIMLKKEEEEEIEWKFTIEVLIIITKVFVVVSDIDRKHYYFIFENKIIKLF
jgi:hypothetical protein